MRKLISICIMFSMLSLAYFQVYGNQETATVVSHIYGMNGVKDVKVGISKEKAEILAKDLKDLKEAIKINDYDTALKIANGLKKDNIIPDNTLFDSLVNQIKKNVAQSQKENVLVKNLSNLLCFILGYGEGLFVYPVDFIAIFLIVLIFGLMPLGILLVLLYSFLWVVFSHLLPFRSVLPITMFGMGSGEITTAGLMGIKTIKPDPAINQSSVLGLFVGFVGLVINIINMPDDEGNTSAPFFVLGYSLASYDLIDTNNTFFNIQSLAQMHQSYPY